MSVKARLSRKRTADIRARKGIAANHAPRKEGTSIWQPIETAPRDGTPINVWLADAGKDDAAFYCVPGTRFSAGWSWVNGKFRPIGGLPGVPVFVQPTHWQHVPKGPQ